MTTPITVCCARCGANHQCIRPDAFDPKGLTPDHAEPRAGAFDGDELALRALQAIMPKPDRHAAAGSTIRFRPAPMLRWIPVLRKWWRDWRRGYSMADRDAMLRKYYAAMKAAREHVDGDEPITMTFTHREANAWRAEIVPAPSPEENR